MSRTAAQECYGDPHTHSKIYQAGATRNYPDKDESRDASRAPALFLTIFVTLNLIAYVVSLSRLIGLTRCELQRGSEDALIIGERSHASNAEILVWSATEATEVVVFARPYQMPIKEVARAIEDGLHMSLLEVAALNNRVHSLENVRRFKFERTSNE